MPVALVVVGLSFVLAGGDSGTGSRAGTVYGAARAPGDGTARTDVRHDAATGETVVELSGMAARTAA